MNKNRNIVNSEFDNFFEFDSNKKTHVTSVSCKLFAEHMMESQQAEITRLNKHVEQVNNDINVLHDSNLELYELNVKQQAEITRLNAIIAENEAGKWISVNDRLPDEKRKVIVYVDRLNYYPNYISTSFRQDGTWREESGNYHNITHWQPLPTPPAIKSE
jgi:hypothetical protein